MVFINCCFFFFLHHSSETVLVLLYQSSNPTSAQNWQCKCTSALHHGRLCRHCSEEDKGKIQLVWTHSATVTASGSLYQTAFGRTSMIQEQEAHFPSPSSKHVIMAPGELEQARWVNDFSPYLSLTTVKSSTWI